MAIQSPDLFRAIEVVTQEGPDVLRRFARAHRGCAYAELRMEVVFSRSASATNGEPRASTEAESATLGVGLHCVARGGVTGYGQSGVELGRLALQPAKLTAAISRALEAGFQRARLSAREKIALLKEAGPAASASLCAETLVEPSNARAEVDAVFKVDARSLDPTQLKRLSLEASRAAGSVSRGVVFNAAAALTEARHELFVNTAGALISQGFAFAQGDCFVVAESGRGHQELYDTIGQQRGFEALSEGCRDELMPNPDLIAFARGLAKEACDLAAVPVLKPPADEVTVVTDPHFNTLLSHEIVGHPAEADRALKMEAAYAGRSWLLRSIADDEIGRRIGSPLLSACSDPTLNGYGHYRYDHEGTEGRRVTLIDGGIFAGFMNSRATAAILGAEPNGSSRASEACYVPLIRMSNTFFLPGQSTPESIIADVDRGYYVCGHQIPSIAESRENFRISARRVYEIDHGRVGRLFRAGSVIADSKRFFMNVDAVGNDLRLVAIPNCGKGQPMQVKRMSNGGPTMRSRARLIGED